MQYKNKNKIKQIEMVCALVQKYYVPGVTTYVGIWREYINPVYPMCYNTFLNYINTPLKAKIR